MDGSVADLLQHPGGPGGARNGDFLMKSDVETVDETPCHIVRDRRIVEGIVFFDGEREMHAEFKIAAVAGAFEKRDSRWVERKLEIVQLIAEGLEI